MGILDGLLSPLLTQTATARGQFLAGRRAGEEADIAKAFTALKAKREAESASIMDALHKAQTQRALQPITEPLEVTVDAAGNRTYTPRSKAVGMNAPVPTVQPSVGTATIGGAGGGPGEVVTFDRRTGQQTGTLGDAPPASAKPTEAEQKEYTFYNLMAKAEPFINKAVESGKVRPAAISLFLTANQVPGGKMMGLADLGRSKLNAEEQVLMRNMFDFAAGVKRKESGAAVSIPEVREVMDRYFPLQFGERDELTADKLRARTEYLNSAKGAATPYMKYLERQQGASRGSQGNNNLATLRAAAEAQLRAQGKTEAQILVELGPPDE